MYSYKLRPEYGREHLLLEFSQGIEEPLFLQELLLVFTELDFKMESERDLWMNDEMLLHISSKAGAFTLTKDVWDFVFILEGPNQTGIHLLNEYLLKSGKLKKWKLILMCIRKKINILSYFLDTNKQTMRRQISNQRTSETSVFLVVVFVLIFVGQLFFYWLNSLFESTSSSSVFLLILPLFLLFYYIFVARFSTVEIDEENLYYRSLFKKGQIPLGSLVSVNPEWLPYNSFGKLSYGITIRYTNVDGRSKTITFQSCEVGMFENSDAIIELKELRKLIKRAKS